MKNPLPRPHCDFCGLGLAEVSYLFSGQLGGIQPQICDRCIASRSAALEQELQTPGFLAGVIALQRVKIKDRWDAEHSISARDPL